MKKSININDARRIVWAIEDVIGYLTDNSCSDPDCCGGPYYTREDYEKGVSVLESFGIKIEDN